MKRFFKWLFRKRIKAHIFYVPLTEAERAKCLEKPNGEVYSLEPRKP